MDNVATFNQLLLTFLVFYLMFLLLRCFYRGCFINCNTKYTTIKNVIDKAMLTLLVVFLTSWIFKEGYNILETSKFQIQNYQEDPLMSILVITTVNVAIILILISLKTVIDLLRIIAFYIILKKDTIPNKFRHALHNRDYSQIITYWDLYLKSNESITLSEAETLTLSACLSKSGRNNELEKLLENRLYKPIPILNTILSSISKDYILQLNNSNLIYSESLKHKLLKHNKLYKLIYIFIFSLGLIQFYFVISKLFIPITTTTVSRITIILTGFIIVGFIFFKYIHLKKIYKSHANNNTVNVSNGNSIIIKKSSPDKIILLGQFIMIITTIVGMLFL
ncbi:hypothetical protein [Staphylococcus aureus]|uniref:hypothetical protein n=1 Tax=Staphylococcus aureus TaxID=1280 RepID=UPI001BFE0AC1|nr:hypothetical protein [Staphylococcus aureus]